MNDLRSAFSRSSGRRIWESRLVFMGRVVLLALSILPVTVLPGGYFPYVVPRAVLLRVAALFLVALLCAIAFTSHARVLRRDPIAIALFVFVAITSVAAVAGVAPVHSLYGGFERMWGVLTLLCLAVYYVALRTLLNVHWQWLILRAAVAIGSIVCVAAAILSLRAGGGVPVFLGNNAYVGIFAFLVTHAALLGVIVSPRLAQFHWGYGVAATAAFVAVFASMERAPVLALLISAVTGGAVFTLLRFRSVAPWILSAAGGVIVLGAATVFLARDSPVVQAIPGLNRLAATTSTDPSVRLRLVYWKAALQEAQRHPLLGIGPENFEVAFGRNFPPESYKLTGVGTTFPDRVHNAYLEILVGSGIAGLIAFVCIWISAGRCMVVGYRYKRISAAEVAIFSGLVSGYLAYLFFWFEDVSSSALLIVLLALLGSRSTGGAMLAFQPGGRATAARLAIVGIAVTVTGWVSYEHGVRVLLASREVPEASAKERSVDQRLEGYRQALAYRAPESVELVTRLVTYTRELGDSLQGLPMEGHRGPMLTRALDDALGHVSWAMRSDPENDLWLWQRSGLLGLAAQVHRDARYYELAVRDLEAAIAISPTRLRLYHTLADLHLLVDDVDAAHDALARATRIYDGFGETYAYKARAYLAAERSAEAARSMDHAIALGYLPGKIEVGILANALTDAGQPARAAKYLEDYLKRTYRGTRVWPGYDRVPPDIAAMVDALLVTYTRAGDTVGVRRITELWAAGAASRR